MATNGTAPSRTPSIPKALVEKPAFEAWAVASLLNGYIAATSGGGAQGYSLDQVDMLWGATQTLERLTKLVYDGTGHIDFGQGGA